MARAMAQRGGYATMEPIIAVDGIKSKMFTAWIAYEAGSGVVKHLLWVGVTICEYEAIWMPTKMELPSRYGTWNTVLVGFCGLGPLLSNINDSWVVSL